MLTDKFSKIKQLFRGGESEGTKPEDYDQVELAKGIKVEMEHTNDKDVATRIAMDHLHEREDYYKVLDKAGLAEELHGE
jgi:hypothetical protein